MRPERALAKLAPAAGMRQGSGGIPEYTAADIAAALAGCDDPLATMLVLYKWALMGDIAQKLERAAYLMAVDIAVKEKWQIPKGKELVRHMTRLAILESSNPPKCNTCNGLGKEYTNEGGLKQIACRACGGGGARRMTGELRSLIVGLDPSRWSKTWGRRYETILDALQRREEYAIRHMSRRMSEGA